MFLVYVGIHAGKAVNATEWRESEKSDILYTKSDPAPALITAPIAGPIPPPLIHARTIKRWLPEQRVDLVVRRAKPRTEPRARAHVRRTTTHARAEVVRAVRARVELRERVQEL